MAKESPARLADLCAIRSLATVGYADVLQEPAENELGELTVRHVGGGVVIGPRNPQGQLELHVIPHGGTEAPAAYFSDRHGSDSLPNLAELVLLNSDLGTTAIANRLVGQIPAAAHRGRSLYVAYFRLSRLFLDANRLLEQDQVPLRPYVGPEALCRDFLLRHGEQVRGQLLAPWLAEVNQLIKSLRPPVVYHHHTYDIVGQAEKPYDRNVRGLRPLAQVFWQRPALEPAGATDRSGYAPREVLEAVANVIAKALAARTGQRPSIRLDYPLLTPPMPYHGCVLERRSDEPRPWHVIYELRKDLLEEPSAIDAWYGVVDTLVSVVADLRARRELEAGNSVGRTSITADAEALLAPE